MPANPLLDPGNRILGWSTGDFSLYGGQPSVSFDIVRANDRPAVDAPHPTSSPIDAAQPASADAADAGSPEIAAVAADISEPAQQFSQPATVSSSLSHDAPAGMTDAPPGVPTATGSSAYVSQPISVISDARHAVDGVAPTALAGTAASDALSVPVLQLASAHDAGIVSVAQSGLGGIAESSLAPVDHLVGQVPDAAAAAGDLVDTLAADTQPIVEAATATVAQVADDMPHVAQDAGTLVDTLAAATQPVAETAAATVAQVADDVPDLASDAGALVDTLATATQPVAEATLGTADDAIEATPPVVSDVFSGTDPAGGITTLVGLVDSEHGYDLGGASGDVVTAAASDSIVDVLASDVADSPLIGEAAHDVVDHPDPLDLHHGFGLG